jgi:hypothetical protein
MAEEDELPFPQAEVNVVEGRRAVRVNLADATELEDRTGHS